MKFFKTDIVNYDMNDLKIESEFLIPFKRKTLNRRSKLSIYNECLIFKDNLENIMGLDKQFRLVNNIDEDILFDKKIFYVFSDGGSFNNGFKNKNLPEYCSLATIITDEKFNVLKEEHLCIENHTNNYAELNSGKNGILWIENYLLENNINKEDVIIIMCSDSQYLMKGINEWMIGWINRDWKNNEGEKISNHDDWRKMYELMKTYNIYTLWIKGHSKVSNNNSKKDIYIKMNNLCDELCTEELSDIKSRFNL